MAKIDNVDAENRELMDYIFDKKKEIPDEIYVKLADLLKKKEQKKKINKVKLFKIKYVLTQVISVASTDFEADQNLCHQHAHILIRESVLRGRRECTHHCFANDILNGDVQLTGCGHPPPSFKPGFTCTATKELDNDHSTLVAGNITSVITVLEFGEYDPTK